MKRGIRAMDRGEARTHSQVESGVSSTEVSLHLCPEHTGHRWGLTQAALCRPRPEESDRCTKAVADLAKRGPRAFTSPVHVYTPMLPTSGLAETRVTSS